jgi:hypothetical protein
MAFSSTLILTDYSGTQQKKVYYCNFASVTSGSVVTGLKNIKYTIFSNKTGTRAGEAIDDTTTAGTVALSGVTSNDVGYLEVYGT